MKILFIDDCASMRAVISAHIIDFGYEVVSISSGHEALEFIHSELPDLILLDVNMPDMDGYETSEKIREYLVDDWIPIIFLTARMEDKDLAKGIEHGGDDYLIKPVSPTVLNAKLIAMNRIATMRKNLLKMTEKVEQANGKLLRMAMIDELTGVANRRCFNERMELCWRLKQYKEKPIGLLMIDVDRFKLYNDSNGHQQGDEALKKIGSIIEDTLYHKTDLACRFGGEEFSVILPGTNAKGCQVVAERIRENIFSANIPYNSDSISEPVSVSIGCAAYNSNQCTTSTLLKLADEALYEAKNKGRNCVVCHEDLKSAAA